MWQKRLSAVIVAVASALLLAACAGGDADADGRPTVVATTGIWGDVVSNVACGGIADVQTVIPDGADPHSFEPSLADRGTLESASLIVANGLGLEESLDDTLSAVEGPAFQVSDHVPGVLGDDPHVWLDPNRVAAMIPALADALVESGGLDRDIVGACANEYIAQLTAADAEAAQMLSSVPDDERTLVTNHDALGYFADRYGFEVLGSVIPAPSTLAQASPAQLEELAKTVEQAGVTTIFSEAQHSDADVQALAQRVGNVDVATLFSGSLGEPDSGAETYTGLVRANARIIAVGLS